MTINNSQPARIALSQQNFLLAAAFLMPLTFSVWQALLNNFVVERAAFTGAEIGMLQSLREVPGFLAFTAVFVLLFVREQRFALGSLLVMSVGVALTPFFPTTYGLYATTVMMSMGFHYFETINKSLTLQWIAKAEAPHFMGRAMAVKAAGALLARRRSGLSGLYPRAPLLLHPVAGQDSDRQRGRCPGPPRLYERAAYGQSETVLVRRIGRPLRRRRHARRRYDRA